MRLSLAFLIKRPYNLIIYPNIKGLGSFIEFLIFIYNMSQPFKLFRLQQLDTHLDQAQNRLTQIDAALSDDKELQQARSEDTTSRSIGRIGSESSPPG